MGEGIPEKETLDETAEGEGRPAGETPEGVPKDEGAEGFGSRLPRAAADKADILNRAIARLIDVLIALLLARFPGFAGFTLGLVYLGVADGLFDGASVGKRIIGLRVVRSQGGPMVSFRESILRNSTMCVLYAALWIPIIGWVVALAGGGFEFLLMLGSPEGKRLGDEIASTVVRDSARRTTDSAGGREGAGADETV